MFLGLFRKLRVRHPIQCWHICITLKRNLPFLAVVPPQPPTSGRCSVRVSQTFLVKGVIQHVTFHACFWRKASLYLKPGKKATLESVRITVPVLKSSCLVDSSRQMFSATLTALLPGSRYFHNERKDAWGVSESKSCLLISSWKKNW